MSEENRFGTSMREVFAMSADSKNSGREPDVDQPSKKKGKKAEKHLEAKGSRKQKRKDRLASMVPGAVETEADSEPGASPDPPNPETDNSEDSQDILPMDRVETGLAIGPDETEKEWLRHLNDVATLAEITIKQSKPTKVVNEIKKALEGKRITECPPRLLEALGLEDLIPQAAQVAEAASEETTEAAQVTIAKPENAQSGEEKPEEEKRSPIPSRKVGNGAGQLYNILSDPSNPPQKQIDAYNDLRAAYIRRGDTSAINRLANLEAKYGVRVKVLTEQLGIEQTDQKKGFNRIVEEFNSKKINPPDFVRQLVALVQSDKTDFGQKAEVANYLVGHWREAQRKVQNSDVRQHLQGNIEGYTTLAKVYSGKQARLKQGIRSEFEVAESEQFDKLLEIVRKKESGLERRVGVMEALIPYVRNRLSDAEQKNAQAEIDKFKKILLELQDININLLTALARVKKLPIEEKLENVVALVAALKQQLAVDGLSLEKSLDYTTRLRRVEAIEADVLDEWLKLNTGSLSQRMAAVGELLAIRQTQLDAARPKGNEKDVAALDEKIKQLHRLDQAFQLRLQRSLARQAVQPPQPETVTEQPQVQAPRRGILQAFNISGGRMPDKVFGIEVAGAPSAKKPEPAPEVKAEEPPQGPEKSKEEIAREKADVLWQKIEAQYFAVDWTPDEIEHEKKNPRFQRKKQEKIEEAYRAFLEKQK